MAIKLNFNFKVCPRPGNLSPSDDLLLSTAVKVLVEQMIKSHKRRPQKLLATRGTRRVRLGHRLKKLAPLSFLAKGKFDVKLCELSLVSVQTDGHFIMSRRAVADRLRQEASGMWHAARGVHKLKCGRVSWESKWGKSKTADRRPHSGGSVLVILRAWPAWPAKKKKEGQQKNILNRRPEASDFFLHLQFWMMANFVFDFCAFSRRRLQLTNI